jgi:NADH-quinone oxidoreductase subunit G
MANTVKIYIDDQAYEVPAGTNLVDAAKWIGNDIPVFCYHPKMKPVGMCRMCLVEMGMIEKDRATGEVVLDDKGSPKIRWMPKLQTACTTTVSDGLVIRTETPQVEAARQNVLEFLLTSHPLDCPICDKGGECPLQNLTMAHGPQDSRMVFEDKMQLDKHVPLGDLIYLDEERCIQCARCIRFQEEIVGDPVLAFHERGRSLQIITTSDPGFDTYFSGNTTDICPVGALTTADFRFGARPWELTGVPTICPHCPVGCDLTASTRLDRDFDGRAMIKRILPRQNEYVNEIWICDKGRFGHHFTRSADRLTQPLLSGKPVNNWVEALNAAANAIGGANGSVAAIASPSLSNEDAFALAQLIGAKGDQRLGAWTFPYTGMDLVAQVGVGKDTNLSQLGKGDAVLIVASNLEEEAPVWRLRLKQAYDRGAYVVVANARHTRMADFASASVTFPVGGAAAWMNDLSAQELGQQIAGMNNVVIVAGAEGLNVDGHRALMQAAANFLIRSGHVGKPNNGLMASFPGANAMGLHYMGFSAETALDIMQNPPKVLILAGVDAYADDPNAAAWLSRVETVITLSLFPDEAAQRAAVALPIQSFAERDGTFTNGERRVQRFYTAQGPMGAALPTWQIVSRIGEKLGVMKTKTSAAAVMLEITQTVSGFEGARYSELAKVERQFPQVGGEDLYYGGTAYKNSGGLGVQIAAAADSGAGMEAGAVSLPAALTGDLIVVPTVSLYNRERTFRPSEAELMAPRIPLPFAAFNPADAQQYGIAAGDHIVVDVEGSALEVQAQIDDTLPQGVALLPRHLATGAAAPYAPAAGQVRELVR